MRLDFTHDATSSVMAAFGNIVTACGSVDDRAGVVVLRLHHLDVCRSVLAGHGQRIWTGHLARCGAA